LVERMLAAPGSLFATPVYWYAMGGRMKVLFDRFTDLLSGHDPARRGRRLAGRAMWMLAVGVDPEEPEGFAVPFRRTADFLGMDWRGEAYLCAKRRESWNRELADLAARIAAGSG
jgi:multimeric flavodoxin WrbA